MLPLRQVVWIEAPTLTPRWHGCATGFMSSGLIQHFKRINCDVQENKVRCLRYSVAAHQLGISVLGSRLPFDRTEKKGYAAGLVTS
jgi:hypothetical protein